MFYCLLRKKTILISRFTLNRNEIWLQIDKYQDPHLTDKVPSCHDEAC